jgi:hypothetical protein
MMNRTKHIVFSILMMHLSFFAMAQIKITGKITAAGTKNEPIENVSIRNLTTNQLEYSNADGTYSIAAKKGDSIRFERMGYFSYRFFIGAAADGIIKRNVILTEKKVVIEGVKVLPKYVIDSIARAERYSKALSYQQTMTIMSPITSLYQQFSKKYKDLRKFQSQFHSMEEQKFIDTKYTYELVNKVTKLEGDAAAYFMNAYPMEYNFARTSNGIEIQTWIKHNWKEYQKKIPLMAVPDSVIKK